MNAESSRSWRCDCPSSWRVPPAPIGPRLHPRLSQPVLEIVADILPNWASRKGIRSSSAAIPR
jgi:hypothetical protein